MKKNTSATVDASIFSNMPAIIPVNSGAINGYSYDSSRELFFVQYNSGAVYAYAGVTQKKADFVIASGSVSFGTAINHTLKSLECYKS